MKLSRLFPLTLAALSLGAAGAQTLVPFSDAKLPFSVSTPKGWLGVDLGDKTNGLNMVSAKTPPATMIRLLFVPKQSSANLNLTNEINGFEEGVRSTGVKVSRQSSYTARYGGLSGIERELLITKDGKSVKMRVWFAQGPKNLYSFQVTDTPQRYAAASTLFTKMMGTLKFK